MVMYTTVIIEVVFKEVWRQKNTEQIHVMHPLLLLPSPVVLYRRGDHTERIIHCMDGYTLCPK